MPRYLLPVTASLIFHLGLIYILLALDNQTVSLPSMVQVTTKPKLPKHEPELKPIESVAVNQQEIDKQVERIKREKQQKIDKEKAAARKLEQMRENARKERIAAAEAKQKRIEEEKLKKRLEQEKKQKAQELAAEKKRIEEAKRKREAEEKAARIAEEKLQREEAERLRKIKLEEERLRKEQEERMRQQALEQELLNELESEAEIINSKINQRIQDEVKKYTAKIQSKIRQNWRAPTGDNGECIFTLSLDPAGYVIEVNHSGATCSVNMSRTGRNAVMAAQPFDVSEEPAVFNEIKNVRFILRNDEN